MTSFDFSAFHSTGDVICLRSETVLVFADPAKWIDIWRQISNPVTAPESESEVRIILLTMTFGSPEVAWRRVYLRKKSALSKADFFCSSFELSLSISSWMSLISVVMSWASWGLFSAIALTLSCSFLTLWAVTLSMLSMFSDKIPLNMTSFSMTAFEAAAAERRGMNSW